MHLIGEVHGHSQLYQEVNTKSITTLGYDWASCNENSNIWKLCTPWWKLVHLLLVSFCLCFFESKGGACRLHRMHDTLIHCRQPHTASLHTGQVCASIPTITQSEWLHAYIYRYLLHIYVCISGGCLAGALEAQ